MTHCMLLVLHKDSAIVKGHVILKATELFIPYHCLQTKWSSHYGHQGVFQSNLDLKSRSSYQPLVH